MAETSLVLREDERLDTLGRDDLRIIQSSSVFSYSTDALVLGDFARVPQSARAKVLDLCAGTGAVSLLLSEQTNAQIIGVELQERLADMAQRSITLNQLDNQVQILQGDVANLRADFSHDTIDAIVCNPPYFKVDEAKISPNPHLALARHELRLDLSTLVREVSRLLKMKGTFFMVYRPERFLELLDELQQHNLVPKRIRFVYPKPHRQATILLVEAIKQGSVAGFAVDSPLYVMDEAGRYTPEMRAIIHG